MTGSFRMSKKWLNATFLSFTGLASRSRSRAAKPAKYENLWVFIRSDAHVVRAGLNIRGCGPLSTPGFFDRLKTRLMPCLFVWLYAVLLIQRRVPLAAASHIAAANRLYVAYGYHSGGAILLDLIHYGLQVLTLYHHQQHTMVIRVSALYVY